MTTDTDLSWVRPTVRAGHDPEDRCWFCATPERIDLATRGERPDGRRLRLDVALEDCPNIEDDEEET